MPGESYPIQPVARIESWHGRESKSRLSTGAALKMFETRLSFPAPDHRFARQRTRIFPSHCFCGPCEGAQLAAYRRSFLTSGKRRFVASTATTDGVAAGAGWFLCLVGRSESLPGRKVFEGMVAQTFVAREFCSHSHLKWEGRLDMESALHESCREIPLQFCGGVEAQQRCEVDGFIPQTEVVRVDQTAVCSVDEDVVWSEIPMTERLVIAFLTEQGGDRVPGGCSNRRRQGGRGLLYQAGEVRAATPLSGGWNVDTGPKRHGPEAVQDGKDDCAIAGPGRLLQGAARQKCCAESRPAFSMEPTFGDLGAGDSQARRGECPHRFNFGVNGGASVPAGSETEHGVIQHDDDMERTMAQRATVPRMSRPHLGQIGQGGGRQPGQRVAHDPMIVRSSASRSARCRPAPLTQIR